MSFELRAAPALEQAGAIVDVEVSHRAPGARESTTRRRVTTLRGESLGRALFLANLDRRSGTTCVVATLRESGARSGRACVRLRPPVELGWVGDTTVGSNWGSPPDGGRALFRPLAARLQRPDLMIGNYEGALSDRGSTGRCGGFGGGGTYCFVAPAARARSLAQAGFDVLNLANNHALDAGTEGRADSVRALAAVGIAGSGLPGAVIVRQVEDTRVAIVGISPYPGTTSTRDMGAIASLVRRAAARADMVVVTIHAGLEGSAGAHVPFGADYGNPTRAAVHAAIDAGADVVFGSGPHVLRGIERYHGRYVVYSSGNFAGWHNYALGGLASQSGIVRMTFDHHGIADGGTWDPVVIGHPGIPRLDRSGRVLRRLGELSRADFGDRGARVAPSGRFR